MFVLIQVIFILSVVLLVYTIFLYPLLLIPIGFARNKQVLRDDQIRNVDLIIPVHNGGAELKDKIENCLNLNYPKEALNIIVVSDASIDDTVHIAHSYADHGVKCMALKERGGKVKAQNKAAEKSKSEIIIFTDVAIKVEPDAVEAIVSNFADPTVGAVSCKDQIIDTTQGGHSEKLYINYDMLVRTLSSSAGSIIGVTGGFYAVRRELVVGGWNPAFPPDFYVALKAIKENYRVIQDARVTARYYTSYSDTAEIHRKVRTISRGMAALFANLYLINPFTYGFTAIQLLSHKIFRWLTPFFLMVCFVSCFSLFWNWGDHPVYSFCFWIQAILYLSCVASYVIGKFFKIRLGVLKFPATFALYNIVILMSWKNVLTGKEFIIWEPTKRVIR